MGINGTLQLAGFASSTVAMILSIAACGKRPLKNALTPIARFILYSRQKMANQRL